MLQKASAIAIWQGVFRKGSEQVGLRMNIGCWLLHPVENDFR